MPTTSQYLQDLVNQKNNLVANLNEMGISATSSEKLNTLVPKVLNIGSKSFAEMSWAEIAKISEEGKALETFGGLFLADTTKKTIELTTGEQITLVILGFNHDDLVGGGKAGITFGMENLLATTYSMNTSNTNVGSWNSSEMRSSTMQTLFSQLPSDLKAVIKTVVKKQTAGNKSTAITTSEDKLFLFCQKEIDNTQVEAQINEGLQYQYWKIIKYPTDAHRRKLLANGSGSTFAWWLRSPDTGNTTHFRGFAGAGTAYQASASALLGVSFGFCI